MARVFFISYDGMTDPLGQSQVIPYLRGLSQKGHDISIISAEKRAAFKNLHESVGYLLRQNNIQWHPVFFSNAVPGISAIGNYRRLKKKVTQFLTSSPGQIIHCRSYIPALIGLTLKKKI